MKKFLIQPTALVVLLWAYGASALSAATYGETFDASLVGWTIDAPVGGVGWAVDGSPSTMIGGISRSGLSLNYNNGVTYTSTNPGGINSGSALSPAISLDGITNPMLRFWSNYQTETRTPDKDRRSVEIWNGAMTVRIAQWTLASVGYAFDRNGGIAGIGPGPSREAYTDLETGVEVTPWHQHNIFLDPAWGTIRVKFLFDTVDGVRNGYAGWAIDDLEVAGNTTPAPTGWPDLFPDLTTTRGLNSLSRSGSAINWSWASANVGDLGVHMIIGNHPQAILDDSFIFFDADHGHYHFSQYADFSLWQNQPGVGLVKLRRSPKRSYCLTDVYQLGTGPSISPGCGGAFQAISYNHQDVYGSGTAGQSIDVTGLANGEYWLVGITDPLSRVREVTKANNVDVVRFTLGTSSATVSDHTSPVAMANGPIVITAANLGTFNGKRAVNVIGSGFDTTLMPIVYDIGTTVIESPFFTLLSATEIWIDVPVGISTPAAIDLVNLRGAAASARLTTGPFIATRSLVINDSVSAVTSGNGDGRINPGENIGLTVTAANDGLEAASGVIGSLSLVTPDAAVTIQNATVIFGDLAIGMQSAGSGPFLFSVAADTATPHPVQLMLTFTDSAAHSWSRTIDYTAYSAGSIAGTVQLDGAGVSGVSVTYTGPLSGSIITAADGTYNFPAIDGSYLLVAKQGTSYASATRTVVTIPSSRTGIDFAFSTTSVQGTARLDGAPLADATVTASGAFAATATTAVDGAYFITKIIESSPSVTLNLIASKTGFLSTAATSVTLPPSRSGVDFAFTTATVSGTVRKDGVALSGAIVTYSGAFAGTVTSAADGTYVITKVFGTAGMLSIKAGQAGFADTAALSVILPPSVSGKDFAFTTATLSGMVTELGGTTPLVGATVTWTGGLSGSTTTAADGSYSLSGVFGKPTVQSIVASKSGYTSSSATTRTLPPNATADLQIGNAGIAVTPASLEVTLAQGQITTRDLNIANSGSLALTWSTTNSLQPYTVDTSDTVGGPVYSWIDISTVGTPLTSFADDTNDGPFDVGFSFPFFGQNFTSFRLCSNGWLSFSSTASTYTNTALPNTSSPGNMIAFFWDDLNFDTGPKAFFKYLDADTLVVQFKDVPFYSNSTLRVTCEAILKSDGSMIFQYESIGNAISATVGVQNATGTVGQTVVNNAAFLHNAMAVRLRPAAKWLTMTQSSGTVPAGASSLLSAGFNTAGLSVGTYNTTIAIDSNANGVPRVNVPVTLTVIPVNTLPTISNIADSSTITGIATSALPFTVGDLETATNTLVITAVSDNPTLVANAGIVLGGSDANRTITVTPVAGQIGTATITVTVFDGALSTSDSFLLTVTAPINTPPTISDIVDRTIIEDGNTGAVPFIIGDAQTAVTSLTLSVASSNTALVPTSRIAFGGSGANRTVKVTPNANASGTAIITITVSDGTLTAFDRFTLTVTAVNDRPTITNIPDRAAMTNTPVGPLTFTIGDVDTPMASLLVTAISSNPTLVPVTGVVFAGTTANRTVTINPAAGQNGTAIITVTVSDSLLTASDTCTVTIGPAGTIGDGLAVTYFNNIDLTGTTVVRVDPEINFNWGNGSPDPAIAADTFSARWTGQVLPAFTETYTFYTTSDDGIRMSVNGVQIINNWTDHGPTVNTGTIALTAGVRANILVEYFENTGGTVAKLEWSSPSRTRELVPQARLFSGPTGIGMLLPRERNDADTVCRGTDLAGQPCF